MTKKLENLKRALELVASEVRDEVHCELNSVGVAEAYTAEVQRIYELLGGVGKFPVNVGGWDLIVDGTFLELDEELHFNRYRAITLSSVLYDTVELATFPRERYTTYCCECERQCLDR